MSKCNNYNEEDNDYFDNRQIVAKSNVEIIVKDNVEIVENGVYIYIYNGNGVYNC